MKGFPILALLTWVVSGTIFGANTTLTGKVLFKGTAPKREVVRMVADPVCVSQNSGKPVYKDDVQVNANGTLGDVIVYVKAGAKPTPTETKPATLDQSGCHYTPHVLAVQTNQPIKILNSDPTLHNVHSMAKSNNNFNMGMATKGQEITKTFTKPELPVRLKCDVHGWMNAYIGVFDHPYFAVTDTNGNFSIKDLPPGKYTIETWQEKLGNQSQEITVTDAGGVKKIEFTYQ